MSPHSLPDQLNNGFGSPLGRTNIQTDTNERKAPRKGALLTTKMKSDIDDGSVTDDHVQRFPPVPLLRGNNGRLRGARRGTAYELRLALE